MTENNQLITESDMMMDMPVEIELSKDEAIELTESIKSTATATCILLKKAHDEKAWKAMGYSSWTKYIEGEFDFTRVRSYQLLAQGEVIKEISEATDSELYLTEKEAKIIKKELPKITKKLKDETEELDDEDERMDRARAILDDEIQHALHNDKDTYDGSDIDDMISEDGGKTEGDYEGYSGPSGGNHGGYQGQSQEEEKVYFTGAYENEEDDEEGQIDFSDSPTGDNTFYYNYMMKMIDIVEEFPNPDEMANEFRNLSDEEKIKIRNKIKYTSAWLNKMAGNI